MGKNSVLQLHSKRLSSENWKVYHPNGKHMFTCGEKKAVWYMDKDLAEEIGDKEIQLTFTPNGNGFEDNEEFGRSARISRCVVSGVTDRLQRHHIVPYCYRTYFPEAFKSKNHHDIVFMNSDRHSDYERLADKFKDEIAKLYGIKTITEFSADYLQYLRQVNKPNSIILNAMHAIFKSGGKLTNEILNEKLNIIADNSDITFDELINYNTIQLYKLYLLFKKETSVYLNEYNRKNRQKFDHGYYVVQKLDTDEKISDFVKLWRNHFIETMQPKYMPEGWSVDFRIKTKI